jgi:sugar phosphate isomerase/epimerase
MANLIGIAQWCLDCIGTEAISRAAALGLGAIHLDFGKPGEDFCIGTREWLELYRHSANIHGIAIRALALNVIEQLGAVGAPDAEPSRKCYDLLRSSIDAAVELGVRLVYVPSFNANEVHNELELDRTADFLREACIHAGESGVEIATENTLGVEDNRALLSKVSHRNLRILIDLYNPVIWGHSVRSLVEAVRPYMCDQIHAKDGRGGFLGNAGLGEGDGRFHETASFLASSAFEGTIVLENDYRSDAERRIAHDLSIVKRYFPCVGA